MSTQKNQIYKCEHCGNIVEVLHGAGAQLICCGEPMSLMGENTTDAAQEKHVPVVEKTSDGIKVTVGSVAHPMGDDHSIEWIEMVDGDAVCRKDLKPGDAPEAVFPCTSETAYARAYCNLHGLWRS